jgi:parvulin-like peptidyl-prolyl isomerase
MLLAEQYSDSELRHKKGLLGIIKKGVLSADFDRVVFNLDKNLPSDVIKSKNGFHLFYVADILHQKNYKVSEVKNILKKELIEIKRNEFIKIQAMKLPQFESLKKVSSEQINEVLLDPKQMLLKVGEFSLNKNQFISQVNETQMLNPNENMDKIVRKYLDDIAYREVIYQYVLSQDFNLKQREKIDSQLVQLLINEISQVKIRKYIEKHPELIDEYYNDNKMRFTTDLELNLIRLVIPRIDGINLMPELEKSIDDLDRNEILLQELADKYNGKLMDLGYQNVYRINQIDPQILTFVTSLEVNKHSAPVTSDNHYHLFKLKDKRESKIQPLENVREKVTFNYIKNNGNFIFNIISKNILETLKINDANVDALIAELQDI